MASAPSGSPGGLGADPPVRGDAEVPTPLAAELPAGVLLWEGWFVFDDSFTLNQVFLFPVSFPLDGVDFFRLIIKKWGSTCRRG